MKTMRLTPRFFVVWVLLFLMATALGMFQASQSIMYWNAKGRELNWSSVLIIGVTDWYAWTALVPFILQITYWLPLDSKRWIYSVPIQGILSICMAFLMIAVMIPVFMANSAPDAQIDTTKTAFRMLFTGHFLFFMWVYWLIAGACYGVTYYRKYEERERRAAQLEAQLAQAQLQMLKMQLHPHFLFNTLHAISCLIHRDVNLADNMIARLGELLRLTLDNEGTQEVALRKELEFSKPYLEIEKARLGSRLSLRWDIEPDSLDGLVPNLILQPLVENAVRHGIAPRPDPGWIAIRSRRQDGKLFLEIEDDGPGLPEDEPSGLTTGIGLVNTRARLQQLYGVTHRFELRKGTAGGLLVRLILPWREAPRPRRDSSAEVTRFGREDTALVGAGRVKRAV